MNILGVNISHDSSAALIKDGRIVADVAEERFSRVKHSCEFPARAIRHCLNAGNLSSHELDIIAIASSIPSPLFDLFFPTPDMMSTRHWAKHQHDFFSNSAIPLYFDRFPIGQATKFHRISHHLAHAASAYYTSGFEDRTLVITADGEGEGVSVTAWIGESGKLQPICKVASPGSLGYSYGSVTEALGWWIGDGDGKTMGLAAFGTPLATAELLRKFFPLYSGHRLVRGIDFDLTKPYVDHGQSHSHVGTSIDAAKTVEAHSREDIAAGAQALLEETALEIVGSLLEQTSARYAAFAGGVFLNVKLNQAIRENDALESSWVFPNAGDSGLALGATLHAASSYGEWGLSPRISEIFWGPEYDDPAIARHLEDRHISYRRVLDIPGEICRILQTGEPIALFQGRMESGPRALGSRSILASPSDPDARQRINRQVKFREDFRPFCPSLLESDSAALLRRSITDPFMIQAFDALPELTSAAPAIVHVDGTVRPQVVRPQDSPLLAEIIETFKQTTSIPCVLNTSFNLAGEPLACSPADATSTFFSSGLRFMMMGNLLVEKGT